MAMAVDETETYDPLFYIHFNSILLLFRVISSNLYFRILKALF